MTRLLAATIAALALTASLAAPASADITWGRSGPAQTRDITWG
ncbi:hypothetical protein J2X46_002680 [Nocardioides sp. BE266]|nr:hypothetical protein [Nocardioides sp. BE266]MDR7253690.1 hypothetical protein [Nocardioides sp. BE266]